MLYNANQNYVYAKHCKEVKQELFNQLAMSDTIISGLQSEISANKALNANCEARVSEKEKEAADAKKEAKKQKRFRKINGVLVYVVGGVAVAMGILYLAK